MQAWWQNPDEVDLVQFMGKDNVPFHTIIFPATQIGDGRKWTKMKNISVTEYLNYEGGKFSKGRNIGVFGDDAKKTGIPPEVVSTLRKNLVDISECQAGSTAVGCFDSVLLRRLITTNSCEIGVNSCGIDSISSVVDQIPT